MTTIPDWDALNFDLHALAAPKSRADLIALVKEIHAEFSLIREHMERILDKKDQLTEA